MPTELPRGDDLRAEIAAVAARLIADEGADWVGARRQAARIVLGAAIDRRSRVPDNEEIESALRAHLRTFAADSHPLLLAALRRAALAVMERWAAFDPQLVGGVLNGTATEHSTLGFELFVDSAKDVEIALLNAGLDYQAVAADPDDTPAPQEILTFILPTPRNVGLPPRMASIDVKLTIFERKAMRVAPRSRPAEPGQHPIEAAGRAGLAMLKRLIAETAP